MRQLENNLKQPRQSQTVLLAKILKQIAPCRIARDLNLTADLSVDQFRTQVPITTYEFYQPYIDRITHGSSSELFEGSPIVLAETGGSTNAPKLFPLGKNLIKSYRQFNLDMAFCFMKEQSDYSLLNDRIFLCVAIPGAKHPTSGTPIGRATGVMAQIAPSIIRKKYVPTMEVILNHNLKSRLAETNQQAFEKRTNIRMAAGLTPYLIATFSNLLQYAGQNGSGADSISKLCPELRVVFHGGTSFEFYTQKIKAITGPSVAQRNIYSAAEAPIALQCKEDDAGLALALDAVFFEFLPLDQLHLIRPKTLLIDEVVCGVPYLLLLTTQGGLLRYNIGDQVEFVSTTPPLLKVLGRIKEQIDLCGEKFDVESASRALQIAARGEGLEISDFIVSPAPITAEGQQIAHHWIIECDVLPESADQFRARLETAISAENYRYQKLREQDFILRPPEITFVKQGTFADYMIQEFHFGQQKLIHMHNNRNCADRIMQYA